MKDIDVLNLEWPGNERDVHAVAPVILELRERGFLCVTGDVFSYQLYLLYYRPRVLLISNFQGAVINHDLCTIAHNLGIKVISLIAEGNVRESAIAQMTWGNNKAREVYFDKLLLWSSRSENFIHEYYPELKGKTKVTGNVAADRYKRLNFTSKQEFLDKEFPSFSASKVVGLAGWGFDRIHETSFFQGNKEVILKNSSLEQVLRHRSDFIELKAFYNKIIKDNPTVIFILRPHPGLTEEKYNEFLGLDKYPNIYYSQPRECRYSISDLISVSDLWGGYETTTCLEAWLLDKQTFLVNPSGGDFIRDITAEGSYIVSTYQKLDELVSSNKKAEDIILNSTQIKLRKESIIEGVIGFNDGESYLRATTEVEDALNCTTKPKYNVGDVIFKLNPVNFIKNILRNINALNRLRGLREVDNSQVEKALLMYK